MNRNDELMHYGVLGMKWGQRRARKYYEKANRYKSPGVNKRYMNSDGSLNEKGVKKYARKSYAKNQLKNEGRLGRAYDRFTGAHKISADIQYNSNSYAKNRSAANAYVNSMGKSKKANKYEAKAKKIEKYHTEMAGGKKAYNYTKNQSTGKALAKSYLMGTYGAAKYNQARAKGDSRLRAGAKGVLSSYGNQLTGGALSVVEPRLNRPSKKRKK